MVYSPASSGHASANKASLDQLSNMGGDKRLDADQFDVDQMDAIAENIAGTGNLNIGVILDHEAENAQRSGSLAHDRERDQLGNEQSNARVGGQAGVAEGAAALSSAGAAFAVQGAGLVNAAPAESNNVEADSPDILTGAGDENGNSGGRSANAANGGGNSSPGQNGDNGRTSAENGSAGENGAATNEIKNFNTIQNFGGKNGVDGDDGGQGDAGLAGPKGDAGSSGNDGNDGEDGDDGTDGLMKELLPTNLLNIELDVSSIIDLSQKAINLNQGLNVDILDLDIITQNLSLSISPDGGISTGVDFDVFNNFIDVSLTAGDPLLNTLLTGGVTIDGKTLISLNDPSTYGSIVDADVGLLNAEGELAPELSLDVLGNTALSLNDENTAGQLADVDLGVINAEGELAPEITVDVLGNPIVSLNDDATDGTIVNADASLTDEDGNLNPEVEIEVLGEPIISLNDDDTDGTIVDADVSLIDEDGGINPEIDLEVLGNPLLSINDDDSDGSLIDANVSLIDEDGGLAPEIDLDLGGHSLLSLKPGPLGGHGTNKISEIQDNVLGEDNGLVDLDLSSLADSGSDVLAGVGADPEALVEAPLEGVDTSTIEEAVNELTDTDLGLTDGIDPITTDAAAQITDSAPSSLDVANSLLDDGIESPDLGTELQELDINLGGDENNLGSELELLEGDDGAGDGLLGMVLGEDDADVPGDLGTDDIDIDTAGELADESCDAVADTIDQATSLTECETDHSGGLGSIL